MTGRILDEVWGKLHFWLTFIGFHLTFLVQHWLGNQGMPRRYADYLPSDGFTTLNMISTAERGAGLSTLPFLWNVFRSYRYGEVVTVDDPWGFGNSLEWSRLVPAAAPHFTEPRIRSERPAFELHYPHMIERMRAKRGRQRQPTGGPTRRTIGPHHCQRSHDRPGVTSVLMGVLAQAGVELPRRRAGRYPRSSDAGRPGRRCARRGRPRSRR